MTLRGLTPKITATAHKLARILYALIQSGSPYSENTAFPAKPQNESKQRRQLEILAQKLGLQVTPIPATILT